MEISPSTHTRCISPVLLFPVPLHWSLLWINGVIHIKLRMTRQGASVQNLVSSCSCLAMPFLSCGNGVAKNCQTSVACKGVTGKLSPEFLLCSCSLLIANHQQGFGATVKGISESSPHSGSGCGKGPSERRGRRSRRLSGTFPGLL